MAGPKERMRKPCRACRKRGACWRRSCGPRRGTACRGRGRRTRRPHVHAKKVPRRAPARVGMVVRSIAQAMAEPRWRRENAW
eukprot:4938772-Pleurochrysis_carterae.AAC.3